MNTKHLAKHLYYNNNCFLKNEITKKFADFYFKNENHKYELYHFYIFGIDRLNDMIDNYDNDDTYFSFILKNDIDKKFRFENGEINFTNNSIIKISEIFTYIFIGEFKYKNLICNMFLKLNESSGNINGFCVDLDMEDSFFKKFKKFKKFDKNLNLDINNEIKDYLLRYSKG